MPFSVFLIVLLFFIVNGYDNESFYEYRFYHFKCVFLGKYFSANKIFTSQKLTNFFNLYRNIDGNENKSNIEKRIIFITIFVYNLFVTISISFCLLKDDDIFFLYKVKPL
jgi:hypothetical protein